jgi:hypothetical protein
MRAWPAPDLPTVPVRGPQVRVHNSATDDLVELVPAGGTARMYVCGITPYDATHLGHAATYVAFDLLNRAWRSAGHAVRYVQNVTDVDDPLLERAVETGQDWTELAERETELFRTDMGALRVLPPDEYVGAVESIPLVVRMIEQLRDSGAVYEVPASHAEEASDLYFSVTADPSFGSVSGWSRGQMLEVFPERGGDPDRVGKKDPLDCLLWQAERPDDPAWSTSLGRGRPGWHIECSAIAREHLGAGFDVQGGGSDLVFPHHEMSASEAQVVDRRTGLHAPTCTPAWSGWTARRCRSRAATWSWSPASAGRESTRWRSAGPSSATTTAPTGSGSRATWRRLRRPTTRSRRRPHDQPAPPPARSSAACWPRSPTTWTLRAPAGCSSSGPRRHWQATPPRLEPATPSERSPTRRSASRSEAARLSPPGSPDA